MLPPELSPDDRRLVDSLLGPWEEAVERGEKPRPEAICPDRPDLWAAIVARAAQLEQMAFLDGVDEADVRPGDLLAGRYRLVEPIGSGGHAEVWRARDEKLPRDVAVKMISVGSLAGPQRLREEGERLANLSHPHIVQVFDAGVEDEIAFVVQELVTGDTLAERIEIGPPTEKQTLEWISQVATALQAVHEPPAGVIHRDIKPANILIDGHGMTRLADFGIALPISGAAGGTTVGTLPYKSPEQLDDRPLDRRSDVFSLGLVLYESLTGTLPYSALDRDTIRREMREPLGQRTARIPAPRPLPRRFLPLLERTLAVHPDARPRDAIAFRDALLATAAAPRAAVSRQTPDRKTLWLAAAIGGLAAAALFAAWISRDREPPVVARPADPPRPRVEPTPIEPEVQQAIDQSRQLFKEVQGKISDVMKLDQDILRQTRERDPFRQERQRTDDVSRPPPRPARESSPGR